MLFVSRNKNAVHFSEWATKIIFTHHMGNEEEREILAADLLKISPKQFKDAMKGNTGTLSCIYLLELGPAHILRNSIADLSDLPDDANVYKYGTKIHSA